MTLQEKFEYIKDFPTYNNGWDGWYYTRPCKIWDLGLTDKQISAFCDDALADFWAQNGELSKDIYQLGRSGGHLILDMDDDYARPSSWKNFNSFADLVQYERDQFWGRTLSRREANEARTTASYKVNKTYDILVDFDKRCDKLIENLKDLLDDRGADEYQ